MNKEHQLQAKCVSLFSDLFPERRGDLIATFQETTSKAQGSQMLALGLVPGVSDLLLLNSGVLTAIEMKYPNTYHDTLHVLEQIRFIHKNAYDGWFCTSERMFEDIVCDTGRGIDPEDVIEWCENSISKKQKLTGTETLDQLISIAKMYKKKHKKSIGSVKF